MAERLIGTRTFLFTDIEGSTHRWEVDPEGMRIDLAEHDRVLRAAVARCGGEVFKHTGDGVGAVFEDPAAAIDMAIGVQRELQLPVRIGMASGQAEPRDGDYFGPALNRAARVMDAGHGGQILLAESTAALVDTSDYIDLGVHKLRDVAAPNRLTQVVADGLRIDFPPIRTLSAVQSNLTLQTTSLVGRDEQVRQIGDAVRSGRLVTLTGTGGVGKTRLAETVAGGLIAEFADGVWMLELASISEVEAVPSLVAESVGLTVGAERARGDTVVEALRGRQLLLVFDNCEHVMAGVRELVDAIVQNLDDVTVLATSREHLGVRGERVWPVPPLDVESGVDSGAVRLFVERAQAANPQFRPEPGSDAIEAVAAICSGLDGVALAIELAAARMVSMSPQDVANRLDHRFRLLSTSAEHGGTAHHRTLRDTVAWSFELLDDDERSLLMRCAAFASGFEFESVWAICDGDFRDEYAVLDLLDSLVRKSLLTIDTGPSRTRYRMLETIRQFAEEQAVAAGSIEAIRRKHAAFFGDRSQEMWQRWNGRDQRTAINWVDAEFAELRAAFRWSTDHRDIETASQIASHAAMLSFVLQRFEPVDWVDEIIEHAIAADIAQLPRVYTAACVSALGGGHQAAIESAQEAIRLATDPQRDPFEYGWSRFWEAIGHRYLGEIDRWFEICMELSEEPDELTRLMGRCGLQGTLAGVGRAEEARAIADQVVAEARAYGNPFWIAWADAGWGRAYASSDPVSALRRLRECLEYTRVERLDFLRAVVQREIAALEESGGGVHEAIERFVDVIDDYRTSGNSASAATTLGEIAVMFDRLGRPETAATVYGASLSVGFSIAEQLPPVVDRLRADLGDETFRKHVEVGSSMEFGESMSYVRRLLEDTAEQESPVDPSQ